MASMTDRFGHGTPSILTVPGFGGSGPGHWQTMWEARADTTRADLGMWDRPRRNAWVTRLDHAIRAADAPVVLAAHGLGCLAVAWWVELVGQAWGWPVAGALLVAPPDGETLAQVPAIGDFAPAPAALLPFPAIVVASGTDPFAAIQCASDMARDWGAAFETAGTLGHINAASEIGDWPQGRRLLDRVIAAAEAAGAAHPLAIGAEAFANARTDQASLVEKRPPLPSR